MPPTGLFDGAAQARAAPTIGPVVVVVVVAVAVAVAVVDRALELNADGPVDGFRSWRWL